MDEDLFDRACADEAWPYRHAQLQAFGRALPKHGRDRCLCAVVNAARAHALSPRRRGQDNPIKELENFRIACREFHRATQALSPSARKFLEDHRDVFKIPVEDGSLFFLINEPSNPDMVERELYRFEREHRRAFDPKRATLPSGAARGCPRGSVDEALILALRDAWDAVPEPDPELRAGQILAV